MAAPRAPLVVTTSDRADPALAARARTAAEEIGVPYVARHHKLPLRKILDELADVAFVFEAGAVVVADARGSLRFTPGLAHLRAKQLDAGVEEDMLLRVGGLEEGDAVLDCTLGLAGDAQVAARLVGARGSVVGLEKSPAVYLLARYGLESLARHPRACRIDVLHADAADYLRTAPGAAFDFVLLDPMFARARRSSFAFQDLRRFADYSPLTREMISDARRVARKAVLVKGSRYSSDLRKLGIEPMPARPNATVLWARLPGAQAAAQPVCANRPRALRRDR